MSVLLKIRLADGFSLEQASKFLMLLKEGGLKSLKIDDVIAELEPYKLLSQFTLERGAPNACAHVQPISVPFDLPGLVVETIAEKLAFPDVFRLSRVSKFFRSSVRNQLISKLPSCFHFSFCRRILQTELPLDRSTEIFNFSLNAFKKNEDCRNVKHIESSPALLEQIRCSGSSYAHSQPIKEATGIETMHDLNEMIAMLPIEKRNEIYGLDLKGFNFNYEYLIEDLRMIVEHCPHLVKVQFYAEDFTDSSQIRDLCHYGDGLKNVKIRIH